ncbi:MAG: hypothetical protein ACP5QB_10105 [Thiomonas sp.]
MSLIGMATYYMTHQVSYCRGPQGFFVVNKRGSILPQLRQELVDDALRKADPTHLLFIDSDEAFPPSALNRLLEHRKQVVGVNFPIKKTPSGWTARMRKNGTFVPVNSSPTSPALGQVDRIGTGMLLIEADVFKNLRRPWFSIEWRNDMVVGEDWWLCERLDEAGVPIFVDHRLSLEVEHIGEYGFSSKDVAHDYGTVTGAPFCEVANDEATGN